MDGKAVLDGMAKMARCLGDHTGNLKEICRSSLSYLVKIHWIMAISNYYF